MSLNGFQERNRQLDELMKKFEVVLTENEQAVKKITAAVVGGDE